MKNVRLFLAMLLQICTVGAMEMNRCSQSCLIGYQFCEPQKGICRQCSDFDEYCFKDNLHVANCSTYCKEKFKNQDTYSCNNDLWLYIPSVIAFVVICLYLGPVIYRTCRRCRKVKHNLSPADTTPTADEKEQETCLMTEDAPDQFVRLREIELESNGNITAPPPNGFVPMNQIITTGGNACGGEMYVSGKSLNPRDIP